MVSSSQSVVLGRGSWWALNGLHLVEREGEQAVLAELRESIVESRDRRGDELERVRRAEGEMVGLDRTDHDLLDGVVGQHLAEEHVPVERGDFRSAEVTAERADPVTGSLSNLAASRIVCATGSMTPGLSRTVKQWSWLARERLGGRGLDERIGEHLAGQLPRS